MVRSVAARASRNNGSQFVAATATPFDQFRASRQGFAVQGILANRYRLERQLGKGGMGSVWLAEHLALRSWVAVKLMDPAIAATAEGAERFRREAQAAASLRSAHVVQVLDYGVHEATPFLVMELLHGESLAGCLEREKRLTPERTLSIMTQVARALGRAHNAGIVHRDLKPDNIFLVKEDDQELVKILDFGIAKTPQSTFGGMETRTGVTMGTPYYMSPEQVEGKRAVDFRTDLWAMAVITSECMTGVRPFDGSTFGELLLNICARPIAPPSSQGLHLAGFDAWFAKATSRESEQRFSSAQELATTLADVVRGASQAGYVAAPTPAPVISSPAAPYAPAATAGPYQPAAAPYQPAAAPYQPAAAPTPAPVTGAGLSASSINTSQAIDQALRASKPGALPWILLGVVVVLSGIGAALLLLRSPSSNAAAEGAPSASTTPAPPASVSTEPTAPAARASSEPSPTHDSKPLSNKPATSPSAPAGAAPVAAAPVAAAPVAAAPVTTPPTSAPATTPPTTSKPATTPKTLQCFSDPFSGQIRPAGVTRPAGAAVFACQMDPFTGKYKRL
jgi:serine/threonine-protein kinase